MSSLFSCFGKKGASKKTGKEPKDKKNKRRSKSSPDEGKANDVPVPDERKPPVEDEGHELNIAIPDIIEEHGTKEPQSPLIKELEEKLLERRDKAGDDDKPEAEVKEQRADVNTKGVNRTSVETTEVKDAISLEKNVAKDAIAVEKTEVKEDLSFEKTEVKDIEEKTQTTVTEHRESTVSTNDNEHTEEETENIVKTTSHLITSQISSSSVVTENSFDSEIEQMRVDFEQTKEENSKLREFISKLEQEATKDVKDMRDQIENLQTKIDELERTNKDLKESESKMKEEFQQSQSEIQTPENNEQEVRMVHAVKDRENILTAFDQLTKMCMFLEPRLEKIEQFKFNHNNNDVKDIVPRITNLNNDQDHLQNEVNGLVKSLQQLECRVIRLEVDEKESETNDVMNKELEDATTRLQNLEKENKRLKEDAQQMKESLAKKSGTIEKLEREKNHMSSQMTLFVADLEKYKKKVEDSQVALREKDAELENSYRSRARAEDETKMQSIKTQTMVAQLRSKEEECKILETQNKELQSTCADALQRLQHTAQPKINGTASKPVPVVEIQNDCSSVMTITERFHGELYGKMWREALDRLMTVCKRDEKKSLQILMDFCTEAYLHCRRIARQQLDTVCSLLTNPSAPHGRGSITKRGGSAKHTAVDRLPQPLRQYIFEFRKTPSSEFMDNLYDDFLNQLDFQKSRHLRSFHMKEVNEIAPYVNSCLSISWEMVTQDPPMYLQFKVRHGSDVDMDKFSFYSRPGHVVDYLVWPALLREENGAILQKGVVQVVPTKP